MATSIPRRSRAAVLLAGSLTAALLAAAPSAVAAPPNDDFRDATPIRVGQTIRGTTAGATHERGEPQHGPGTDAAVWYRLRSARRVTVLLNTCRSDGDPVIAVYAGRRVNSLRVIDFNDDGCSGLGSRVSFTALAGRTYRIAVAEYNEDDSGRFYLGAQAIVAPRNDDFADARSLGLGSTTAGTARNATLELREPFNEPHSVWFKLRVSTPTRVALNACNGSEPYIAVYTGRSVSRLRAVPGAQGYCRLTFRATSGVTYRIQISDDGAGGRFRLSARVR